MKTQITISAQQLSEATRCMERIKLTVDAYIYGNWAAHKAIGSGYIVTHIPTGIRAGFKNKLATAKQQAEFMHQGESAYPPAVFTFGEQPDKEWVMAVGARYMAFNDDTAIS